MQEVHFGVTKVEVDEFFNFLSQAMSDKGIMSDLKIVEYKQFPFKDGLSYRNIESLVEVCAIVKGALGKKK